MPNAHDIDGEWYRDLRTRKALTHIVPRGTGLTVCGLVPADGDDCERWEISDIGVPDPCPRCFRAAVSSQ